MTLESPSGIKWFQAPRHEPKQLSFFRSDDDGKDVLHRL